MKIEVLYFAGCPNYQAAVDRLKSVLQQEGVALGFFGSPTIRINGIDVDPDARDLVQTGMACRRYPSGAPAEGLIRAALKEAMEQ